LSTGLTTLELVGLVIVFAIGICWLLTREDD
jgi:hypothetical protein